MKVSAIHAYIAALGASGAHGSASWWIGEVVSPCQTKSSGASRAHRTGRSLRVARHPKRAGEPAATASLTFIPLASAVLLFGQAAAVFSSRSLATIAELFLRKQPPLKTVFNLSQYVLSAAVCRVGVHSTWRGSPAASPGSEGFSIHVLAAVLGFGFVALLTNHFAVTAAISITRANR
jgi:hypothetical protein